MEAQLALLEDEGSDWRIDERTRERGRRGIAAARAVLAGAISQAHRPAA